MCWGVAIFGVVGFCVFMCLRFRGVAFGVLILRFLCVLGFEFFLFFRFYVFLWCLFVVRVFYVCVVYVLWFLRLFGFLCFVLSFCLWFVGFQVLYF